MVDVSLLEKPFKPKFENIDDIRQITQGILYNISNIPFFLKSKFKKTVVCINGLDILYKHEYFLYDDEWGIPMTVKNVEHKIVNYALNDFLSYYPSSDIEKIYFSYNRHEDLYVVIYGKNGKIEMKCVFNSPFFLGSEEALCKYVELTHLIINEKEKIITSHTIPWKTVIDAVYRN
jgi:hypothetical protein